MEWFASVWDAARGQNRSFSGDAPNRQSAIEQVTTAGRSLARPQPETLISMLGKVRIDGERGYSVPFGDENVSDDEMAKMIQAAIENERDRSPRSTHETVPVAAHGPTRYDTPASSISEQWCRIEAWLGEHLASPSIPKALPDAVNETATRTEVDWPEELRTFFTLVNGFPVDQWINLFPEHELFDLDRVLDERQVELEVWAEFSGDAVDQPAGVVAGPWLPEFIPFAGVDGNFLFVDTRPGPLYGCISGFDKTFADNSGPQWMSLSALLADLADALEGGGAFAGGWKADVVHGRLTWTWTG